MTVIGKNVYTFLLKFIGITTLPKFESSWNGEI